MIDTLYDRLSPLLGTSQLTEDENEVLKLALEACEEDFDRILVYHLRKEAITLGLELEDLKGITHVHT